MYTYHKVRNTSAAAQEKSNVKEKVVETRASGEKEMEDLAAHVKHSERCWQCLHELHWCLAKLKLA
jgi:PP-loop superfamily ATP-utilizing enzyme